MTHANESARSGPYELLEPIGQDAVTHAFAARRADGPRGQLMRLELLHAELAREDHVRARFLDQAAAMLSLSHPALPRVWEVLTEADACGVVLELVPGRSLAEVLQRTGRARCPVDIHLHVLRQALSGLAHAHAQATSSGSRAGFVHGDVCPGRVHVGYAGEVQLLGGGLAACRHALSLKRGRPIVDVRYAAPEVLLGEPAGPSADIFSLGVMLWEALARQSRTSDVELAGLGRRRTLGQEPDLASAWPEAPDPVLHLCARALALDPRERYASAADMAADLDAYLELAGEPGAAVRARVPGWLAATFGERRVGRSSEPPGRRDGTLASPSREPARPVLELALYPSPLPEVAVAVRAPGPLTPAEPLPVDALPEPHAPSDTGGHRAYSSTWHATPPGSRPAWAAVTAALPALTVAAGAVAAVWVVLGHGAAREGHVDVAAGAAAALLPAAGDTTGPRTAAARRAGADAGVQHGSGPAPMAEPPAFFAGRVPSPLRSDRTPPLALDELPQVDDARDSLQAAIVRSARAQRRATRPRSSRPSGATPAEADPASVPTRELVTEP